MDDRSIESIIGTLGDKIQQCRKEAGLTLNQLSQAAGVSPAAIRSWSWKGRYPSC